MRALARMSRPRLAALVALVLGVALFAVSLVRAVRIEAAPAAVAAADSLGVPEIPERGAATNGVDDAIDAAVEVNPFHPARTRPGARYVLGGGAPGVQSAAAQAPRVPIPMLRLNGIVTQPSGRGLAALSINGRPARIVRVGQTIEGGFKLTRIQTGSVTLTRPDTTLVVRLPGAPNEP